MVLVVGWPGLNTRWLSARVASNSGITRQVVGSSEVVPQAQLTLVPQTHRIGAAPYPAQLEQPR